MNPPVPTLDADPTLSWYLHLPGELKLAINHYVSLFEHRRLQLTNHELLAEGYEYLPEIVGAPLDRFLAIPDGQLGLLEAFECYQAATGQQINAALARFSDLTRFRRLCVHSGPSVKGFDIAAVFLPASLLHLDLALPHNTKADETPLFEYMCSNLTGLKSLSLNLLIKWPKLAAVTKLESLEALAMTEVIGIPNEPSKAVAFLRKILPPAIRFDRLRLNHINETEIFENSDEEPIEQLRHYYNLGFRIGREFKMTECLDFTPMLLQSYIRQGWIDKPKLQENFLQLMATVDDEIQYNIFVEEIFLPLHKAQAEACGAKSAAELRKVTTSMFEFENPHVPGVKYSAMVFATRAFISRLLGNPSRLYFDCNALYNGRRIEYFYSNTQMQEEFEMNGYILAPKFEENFLDFFRELNQAIHSASAVLGLKRLVDVKPYFQRCFARPHYFTSHAKAILRTCLGFPVSSSEGTEILIRLLTAPPIYIVLAFRETLPRLVPGMVRRLVANDQTNLVAFATFASGVDTYVNAWLKTYGPKAELPDGEGVLHLLCRYRKRFIPNLPSPSLDPIRVQIPSNSPVARAANNAGRFPIFHWIRVAFFDPRLKPAFESLIRHFGLDVNKLDTNGTTLQAHMLRSAFDATLELASLRNLDEYQKQLAALNINSKATGPELEKQGSAINSLYQAVTKAIFGCDLALSRLPHIG